MNRREAGEVGIGLYNVLQLLKCLYQRYIIANKKRL